MPHQTNHNQNMHRRVWFGGWRCCIFEFIFSCVSGLFVHKFYRLWVGRGSIWTNKWERRTGFLCIFALCLSEVDVLRHMVRDFIILWQFCIWWNDNFQLYFTNFYYYYYYRPLCHSCQRSVWNRKFVGTHQTAAQRNT